VLDARESDAREVRSGVLTCSSCGFEASVSDGVVDLMPDPPEVVRREAAGLERFADVMRADGWDRERVLRLPDDPLEYWQGQKAAMEHLLSSVEMRPGSTLLDVGSNTCWASNVFASRGLDVIALDISTAEMQGLHTADWWFEANGVYFERVLSTMFDPAIASESLDFVFCCEVLHHNAKPELRRTLAELHRVLKPGGLLIVLSEPLRFPTNLKRDHGTEVAQFEGNENVYFFHEYVLAARRAGFEVEVVEPRTPAFTGQPLWLTAESSALGSAKVFAQQLLRRSRAGRRALLGYTMLLGPDAALGLLCRKRDASHDRDQPVRDAPS
jgi:SAM-dependent methyltransferase